MIQEILVAVVGGILVLVLMAIRRPIWRMIWRISRWLGNKRQVRESCPNEGVRLTTGELRHRGCFQPGEEIDEPRPGTRFLGMGPCGVCGVHLRQPRRKNPS